MNVERARVAVIAVTPNAVEKLLASDHAIRALGHHREQAELFICQLNFLPVANYPNVVEIDQQMIVFVSLPAGLIHAPHDRAHTRQQFSN